MPVSAYFDSSGSTKREGERILTLAGLCAADSTWAEFRRFWKVEVLKPFRISSLHMTYLYAARGEFGGWSEDRKRAIETASFNVLGKLLIKGLRAAVCSVQLEDYRRAKEQFPGIHLESPESMCVDYCMSQVLAITKEDVGKSGTVTLYFDRTERFLNKINRVWQRKKKSAGWPRLIRDIVAVDQKEHYEIQACDMFAWSYRRHLTARDIDPEELRLFFVGDRSRVYTYEDFKDDRMLRKPQGRNVGVNQPVKNCDA